MARAWKLGSMPGPDVVDFAVVEVVVGADVAALLELQLAMVATANNARPNRLSVLPANPARHLVITTSQQPDKPRPST